MRSMGILKIGQGVRRRCGHVLLAVTIGALACNSGSAAAVSPAPAWSIDSLALPSVFSANDNSNCTKSFFGCDAYRVTVTDAGGAPADGSPVTITDTLPAGVSALKIEFGWSALPNAFGGPEAELSSHCTLSPVVRCRLATAEEGWPAVAPDDRLEMTVYVASEPGLSGRLTNEVTVSGGGAADASKSVQNEVGGPAPAFGVASFAAPFVGPDNLPVAQAGGHPYEFPTRIDFNNEFRTSVETGHQSFTPISVHNPKDIVIDLPLGLLGSAIAAPQCSFAQLASERGDTELACPRGSRIGRIKVEPKTIAAPYNNYIYNMVPERGYAAEFAYNDQLGDSHVLYSSVAPTPKGYVLRTVSPDVPQVDINDIIATLYGDPAVKDAEAGALPPTGDAQVPFFTNPSACTGEPLKVSLHMDSWQQPGRYNADGTPDFSDPSWVAASDESPPVVGCNLLQFDPGMSVRLDATGADSPSGLSVDLRVLQSESMETLATPPLRDAAVALPAGLSLNPSAADGLGSCSLAQIGLGDAAQPTCPEDSKIGSVEITTPLLEGTVVGSVYLATQDENPFHALFAAYIVVDDPRTGTLLKVPGMLNLDPASGQITGVFKESPQLPFSTLKLHFFGGERGELSTPQGCGTYTATGDLMPWSAPDSGMDALPSDTFAIASGCTSSFNPGFVAGTASTQAGAYTPFSLSLSRNDGEQNLAGLSVTLPKGLLGKISGIPLCPEANATAGTCPDVSRLGSVTAGAGSGPNPFFVTGSAYLTGPYNGGPYGLVEEIPAVAGPFNLGTVVVRQSLRIDPHTAQVTAVSDPLPTILQGIPLRVRRVDVTLDRPGFTFNPTNCNTMAVTGSIVSTQGATANVSSRFQVGGCKELPFKPTFKVATQHNTSKKNGASLDVKVTSSQGQANIGKVAVTLPKALPSRLTTIQQACPEATFNQNPASCPAGSNIGIATAHTPVLASAVAGPAYLVSHGGAAFPDLVLILQGEGVKLELVGSINIKHGVTSSAFNSVPDAPISTFELSLPEGPHSALAATLPAKAKGNLCGTSLVMPTTITGQNGAQIKQNTKIAVTGCGKAKKKTRKHKPRKVRKKKG